MTTSQEGQKDIAMWRHDVRNKLNIITGYAALLRVETLSHDQEEFVGEIETAAKEILSLVNALRERLLRDSASQGDEVLLDE
jgi:signal transduction histidine kinase